jgi:hypothetical protein
MGGTIPTHIFVREHLEPLLGDHGFSLVHEEYHPRAFSNGYSKYRHDRGELRVIYDGKEAQVILDYVLLNEARQPIQDSYQIIQQENTVRGQIEEAGLERLEKALEEFLNNL